MDRSGTAPLLLRVGALIGIAVLINFVLPR
jgi:hypothetical protein